jgi:hypothetical protein
MRMLDLEVVAYIIHGNRQVGKVLFHFGELDSKV